MPAVRSHEAAYAQLVEESDRLFRLVTEAGRPDHVRICFTMCPTPYGGAGELISSVQARPGPGGHHLRPRPRPVASGDGL